MGLSRERRDAVALVVGGYALWTLFEYWLHRIVFHFEPQEGLGARMHWIIHGVHHDHPNDPLRLVMPPAVSVPLGAIVFGILYLLFGAATRPGSAPGSSRATSLRHDPLLHPPLPRARAARAMLRERHMRHHFQDDTRGFGISAPYWDEVFRTSPRAKRPRDEGIAAGCARLASARRSRLGGRS